MIPRERQRRQVPISFPLIQLVTRETSRGDTCAHWVPITEKARHPSPPNEQQNGFKWLDLSRPKQTCHSCIRCGLERTHDAHNLSFFVPSRASPPDYFFCSVFSPACASTAFFKQDLTLTFVFDDASNSICATVGNVAQASL